MSPSTLGKWKMLKGSNNCILTKMYLTVDLVMAGHAGDVLDGKLYVVGGGNNTAGCGDLLALDLAGLGGTPLVETPELR